MTVHRECCNYCMWYGPVNADDTMRKHRPPHDDGTFGGRKVQDMSADPCPGSNKPFARFGCESEKTTTQETDTVTETIAPTACLHHSVADKRGIHADALPVPHCEPGTSYGVWDELAGGFTYVVDCAMDAANWAAEQLDEDPESFGEMDIKAVCRNHEEQPADGCEDCLGEDDEQDEDEEEA